MKQPYLDLCKFQRTANYSPLPSVFSQSGIIQDLQEYKTLKEEPINQICLIQEPSNLQLIDALMKKSCRRFLEAVIEIDDLWFFVVAVNGFIRNSTNLDDAALQDMKIKYPEEATVKVVRKSWGKKYSGMS